MIEVSRSQLSVVDTIYPFGSLKPDTLIIDVAGGLGHASKFLAERYSHLVFEVQDHPEIIADGVAARVPGLHDRISFVPHDMFTPQMLRDRGASAFQIVYLLKVVLHDWDDAHCHRILSSILTGACPGDKILVVDTILPDANPSLSTCMSDVLTVALFGGRHRTLREFQHLFDAVRPGLTVKPWDAGPDNFDGTTIMEVDFIV
jgi:O-methyltransferase domain